MQVLICASEGGLGEIWLAHLTRQGAQAQLVTTEDSAIAALRAQGFDILINDLGMGEAAACTVADFAGYRQPDAQVIFVTRNSFFSDGSIFNLCSNACALVPHDTAPDELFAIAEHHARRSDVSLLS